MAIDITDGGVALSGALLAAVGAASIQIFNGLRARITTLEASIKGCQEDRIADAAARNEQSRLMGSLQATVDYLRRDMERSGAMRAVRIKADGDGRIIDVSNNVESILGWSRSSLVGRDASILVPEDLRPAHDAALSARASDPTIRSGIITLRHERVRHGIAGEVSCRIQLQEIPSEDGKGFVVEIAPL